MSCNYPYTLPEYVRGLPVDSWERTYIEYYMMESDIAQVIPWINVQGESKTYEYEACPPGEMTIWRMFNERPKPGKHSSSFVSFPVRNMEVRLSEVDHALIKAKGLDHLMRLQKANIRAANNQWVIDFMHGDLSPRNPAGLEYYTGDPVGFDGATDMFQRHFANNWDPVAQDFIPGGSLLNIDNASNLQNMISEQLGQPYWIMNPWMRQAIALQQNDTGLHYERNSFGIYQGSGSDSPASKKLELDTWLGWPILTGYQANTRQRGILPFAELPAGGLADPLDDPMTTSIYAVVFGEEGVHGIENAPMERITSGKEVDDCHLFERETLFHRQGWAIGNINAIARLSGIKYGCVTKGC